MNEIPEDILKIVDDMCSKYVYEGPSEQEVAEALLAERERATMVERERCLAICKEQAEKVALLNADRYWQTKRVEGAIRSGEEAGKETAAKLDARLRRHGEKQGRQSHEHETCDSKNL